MLLLSDILQVKSAAELASTLQRMTPHKTAIVELIQMARGSIRKIQSSHKASQEVAKVGNSKPGSSKPGDVPGVHELTEKFGCAVRVVTLAEFKPAEQDWQVPFILKFPPEDKAITDLQVKAEVDGLKAKFKDSENRTTEGRAQRPLKELAATIIKDRFSEVMMGGALRRKVRRRQRWRMAMAISSTSTDCQRR